MDGIPYIQHCLGATVADHIGRHSIHHLVLSCSNVQKCPCHTFSERKSRANVPSYLVLHAVLLHFLTNDSYHHARRRYWNKYLRIILLPVSDILRVGSRRGFPPSYISNLPTDNLS